LDYLAPLHLLFIVLIVNGRQTDGKRRTFLILRIDWSDLELTRYFFIDVGVSIHHVEFGWLYSRILYIIGGLGVFCLWLKLFYFMRMF